MLSGLSMCVTVSGNGRKAEGLGLDYVVPKKRYLTATRTEAAKSLVKYTKVVQSFLLIRQKDKKQV